MEIESNNRAFEIASIILSYLRKDISEEDQQKLDSWLEESEAHRLLFEQLIQEDIQLEEIQKMFSRDLAKAWCSIQQKQQRRRQQRRRRLWQAAAMVLVLVGVAVLFETHYEEPEIPLAENPSSIIMPGRAVAKLTVASGDSYVLDSVVTIKVPNTEIRNGNEIVFQTIDSMLSVPQEKKYNILEIPRGGEYKVVLADGTRVYLNSETVLRFPENFSEKGERVVYLTGEAYFEVSKNEQQPFRVKCGAYDVKVLGTAFNISNYADNAYSHTTLKEGKVEIIREEGEIILQPGQQARLQEGKWEVKQVSVENYTTWMNENFRFESENMEEILKRIARWYVVDVFYANPSVKEYHFSGYLPRYVNIEDVLHLLSLTTHIDFKVKGKTVVVEKN